MTVQPEQGINRELGLGEAISKTFQVFRQGFAKYFVRYAVVGIIVQVATTLAQRAFVVPMLPMNPRLNKSPAFSRDCSAHYSC